jgi:RpiR family carbohydrate utilization transcriptional regulator
MSLLAELGNSSTRRSKSARKIAAFILEDPEAVINMSIATLAARVGVSEPTVNRFCTGLGLKGFPDFKLTLAGELARSAPRMARDIDPGDSCTQVIAKIFESTHACLQATQRALDSGVVEAVVDALAGARSIMLCGLGASSAVALDAQHKLLRFNIPVVAHLDTLNQRMVAAGLGKADCLVCISFTGRTIPIIEVARLGRDAGATVIGITTPGSELAANCDLVLPVESGEDTELYTPMTSRIAQLAVIDVLVTRLAMRQEAGFSDHLQRVTQSLAATRRQKS